MSCLSSQPPFALRPSADAVPAELLELKARIREMPDAVRAELEPLADDACEQARFRGRALAVAREALERFRLDLAAVEFDLAATRRERESLRRLFDREMG